MRWWQCYVGASLLFASAWLPIVRHRGWVTGHDRFDGHIVPEQFHREPQAGSLIDLSAGIQGAPGWPLEDCYLFRGDLTFDIANYHAALGDYCMPARGVCEIVVLWMMAVGVVLAFHLRRTRLVWLVSIPLSGALVLDLLLFARNLRNTLIPLEVAYPQQGPDVAVWGWAAALLGALWITAWSAHEHLGRRPRRIRLSTFD